MNRRTRQVRPFKPIMIFTLICNTNCLPGVVVIIVVVSSVVVAAGVVVVTVVVLSTVVVLIGSAIGKQGVELVNNFSPEACIYPFLMVHYSFKICMHDHSTANTERFQNVLKTLCPGTVGLCLK